MYAADMREFLNRFQADCHDDGGAVRIGDDAFATLLESLCDVIGVELWNHLRHILIHAERSPLPYSVPNSNYRNGHILFTISGIMGLVFNWHQSKFQPGTYEMAATLKAILPDYK